MPFFRRDQSGRKDPAQCPVCNAILGAKFEDETFIAHCEECRATFHFLPYKTVPTVTLDKDKHKGECGCGRCGR